MYPMPTPRGRAPEEGLHLAEIPRFVQYTTPIFAPQQSDSPTANLPLDILVRIIGHLDDIADIARVTRTSRLLYYMTLPQLYRNVTLRSNAKVKSVNGGRPEGFGGGSPFAMALNGLATKNNVALVEHFTLRGQWNEDSEEDYAKGRIPDSTVMLSTLLRIVVDRMARLRSFNWDLTTKPLSPLYQGLAARDTLTQLVVRFPTSRGPRPVIVLPAMPHLRCFWALDIDPMCFPDDMSTLVFGSRRLLDLRLHFSPRMRSQGEQTLSIDMFFGRCFKEGYKPTIRHFALANFFARRPVAFSDFYDTNTCKSATFLDTFGGARSTSASVYVDQTWKHLPSDLKQTHTSLRINEPATQHIKMLENADQTLEHFYCVNDHPKAYSRDSTPVLTTTPDPSPVATSFTNPELVALGKDYLHVLTRKHGQTLKHLLLCDQWALTQQEIGDIVRLCPSLSQLAVALDGQAFEVFRIIVQFLQNLVAIRIFENDTFKSHRDEMTHEDRKIWMGRDFHRLDMHNIQFVGTGSEVFKLLGTRDIIHPDGTVETIRDMVLVGSDDVRHIEIFALDKFDITIEPPVLEAHG